MNYLITGGAGFIGSHFVKHLALNSGLKVNKIRILDKLTYAGNLRNLQGFEDQIEFIEGDICNPDVVFKCLKNIDCVVNFAAESHVDRSIASSDIFIKSNVLGTKNLLDQSLNFPDIKFLQISTDEVYGSIEQGEATENSLLQPNSPYAASKASADLIVRSYSKTYGIETLITRCTNNYGPNQYPEKIIPFFISNLSKGKKVPIYGSGENKRNWIHVEDHCRGISLVLDKGLSGSIYNIAGGEELTNLELTLMLMKLLGIVENRIEFVEDRKGHDFRYAISYEKIKSELGYKPLISFKKGLEETIDWYLSNQDWWSNERI